ncbi:MAG TPA: hypothetical protein ENH93_07590 [Pseudohongiella sp.]|nr:hypothetical protein [Pseudohongiella sp.]HEA62986.1 hypothetical protein [Pseudohongiella sp.]
MYTSPAWLALSPAATKLMSLLHIHWKNDKPVDYGVREAMEKIGCAKGTARRAFEELQRSGFIEMVDESLFSSRSQSKARTWRLTWLPFKDGLPTNEWEKLSLPGQKCTLKGGYRVKI